jgi:hypothetical protein
MVQGCMSILQGIGEIRNPVSQDTGNKPSRLSKTYVVWGCMCRKLDDIQVVLPFTLSPLTYCVKLTVKMTKSHQPQLFHLHRNQCLDDNLEVMRFQLMDDDP